jgi:hypothetical protein
MRPSTFWETDRRRLAWKSPGVSFKQHVFNRDCPVNLMTGRPDQRLLTLALLSEAATGVAERGVYAGSTHKLQAGREFWRAGEIRTVKRAEARAPHSIPQRLVSLQSRTGRAELWIVLDNGATVRVEDTERCPSREG